MWMHRTFPITIPKEKSRALLLILGVMALGIIVVKIFSSVVPYNMDEFSQYGRVMCHLYPNSDLLQQTCHHYDLNLLNTGIILPLRSYEYVGSVGILWYYPLLKLWPEPDSARFLGWVFLVFESLILGRLFRMRWTIILPGLMLFFPFLYEHLADTGPAGFHLLAAVLLFLFIRNWAQTGHWRWPMWSALLVFLAFWVKINFLWLLPGIGILLMNELWTHRSSRLSQARWITTLMQVFLAGSLCTGLICLLVLSTKPSFTDAQTYLDILQSSHMMPLADILHGKWWTSRIFPTFIHHLYAVYQVYNLVAPNYPNNLVLFYDIIAYFSVPLILLFCRVARFDLPAGTARRTWAFFAAFLVTAAVILSTPNSWTMHHTVLSFPFLIMMWLSLLDGLWNMSYLYQRIILQRLCSALLLFMACMNIYFYYTLSQQDSYRAHTGPSQVIARMVANNSALSQRYAYVIIDWGLFSIQGLYGPSTQSVMGPTGMNNRDTLLTLKSRAAEHGRKLLFFYNTMQKEGDTQLLKDVLTVKPCVAIPPQSSWQVLAEPDPVLDAVCGK